MENFNDTNIWRDVVGFEGYYKVSKHGQVYSPPRVVTDKNGVRYLRPEKLLTHLSNGNGYFKVNLYGETVKKSILVHRLVAQAFLPNLDNKPCVNHKDGNKANNSVENLEWCTISENHKHAYDTGLKLKGQNHPNSKLKTEDILNIRSLYKNEKVTHQELSKRFNVARSLIAAILNNKIWTHI
jgi:hypothetical protein